MECSKIASFYKLTSVFDNLVISLCKFTEILTPSIENSVVVFGNNNKSQLATKTVFSITRNYGDNLREGWKNILDFILRLYDLNLLPKNILLVEQFAEETKVYANTYEKNRKERKNSASGFGFFGFFNNTTEDDVESKKSEEKAKNCIENCHIPELLKDSLLTKMFCFDLLTDVSISNKDRAFIIWPFIFEHWKNLISEIIAEFGKIKKLKQEKIILMERLILCILRLCTRLIHLEEMRANLYQALNLLFQPNSVPEPLVKLFHSQIVTGLNLMVSNSGKFIKDASIWTLVLDTLRIAATNKEVRIKAVETIIVIVKENEIMWPDNVPSAVQASIMIGTIYVVEVLTSFHEKMFLNPETVSKPSQMWCKSWLSVLEGFAKLATCTDAEIRHSSLIQLQRIFLDTKVANLPSDLIVSSFHIIIFSLLDQLVNQSVTDIEETRLRAIQVLAKTFLNFLSVLQQVDKLNEIWQETIVYMKKYYVDSNKGSSIFEAVPELLKNLVLVMNSQNIFKENPRIWEITKEQLDGPLADIIKDIKEVETKVEVKNE
jgi:brefeldin A-resistance guanine nucleotide exchange factor 1